jgi:osmotically-inducible protein OsmY
MSAGDVLKNARSQVDKLPNIGSHNLEYHLEKGILTVRGEVSSFQAREDIGKVLGAAPGVTLLVNQITVQPRSHLPLESEVNPSTYTNNELHTLLLERLKAEKGVSLEGVSLSVDQGNVVLYGDKADFESIDKILSVLLMADGVRRVENKATVQGRPYAAIRFPDLSR